MSALTVSSSIIFIKREEKSATLGYVVTQNEKYRGGIITLRTRPHGPVAQPLPLFAG
jgi:hypothetical protein